MNFLIAVTRPKERSEETLRLVESRGFAGLIVPSIEIAPRKLKKSELDLKGFDWLVLTSASGAEIICSLLKDELKNIKIAVIGPKTKEALEKRGIAPSLVAKEYKAEGLAEELKKAAKNKKIVVARASIGREVLIDELKKAAKEVKEVMLYDTVLPKDKCGMFELKEKLEKSEVNAVIFTSSQAAKNLLDFLGKASIQKINKTIVVAIGPITAKTLEEYGVKVNAVPKEYTVNAAIEEIERIQKQ